MPRQVSVARVPDKDDSECSDIELGSEDSERSGSDSEYRRSSDNEGDSEEEEEQEQAPVRRSKPRPIVRQVHVHM